MPGLGIVLPAVEHGDEHSEDHQPVAGHRRRVVAVRAGVPDRPTQCRPDLVHGCQFIVLQRSQWWVVVRLTGAVRAMAIDSAMEVPGRYAGQCGPGLPVLPNVVQ